MQTYEKMIVRSSSAISTPLEIPHKSHLKRELHGCAGAKRNTKDHPDHRHGDAR